MSRRSHSSSKILRVVAITLGLALGGCVMVSADSTAPAAANEKQISILDRLYFGRDIKSGGQVSEAQWAEFLAQVVTPRFPQGLTVWRADGQWRGADGVIVREPSFVLELIHPDGAAPERAVTEIIADYKQRFRQESVMRVRDRVEASF